MMFKLTAMTPQGQWRIFSLRHDDLEQVYQLLHSISQKGDTLVHVTLIDERGYLPLPLDALETATFMNPIQMLKQQWEALLAQPVRGYLSRDEVKQRLTSLRQTRITSIRRTISGIQELVERIQPYSKEESKQDGLLNHYLHILDRYSRLLIRLETDSSWRELVQDAF